MNQYEELRIRAWKTGHRRYLVVANGPAAAAAVVRLPQPPGDYWRRFHRLLAEELGRRPRGEETPQERARRLGRELFALFFPEPLRRALAASLELAQQEGRRLRLRFEVDPELMDLPFELLCSPSPDFLGDLALEASLSLTRSLEGVPSHPLRLPRPDDPRDRVALLVVVAAPEGHPVPAAGREIKEVEQALPPILHALNPAPLQLLGGGGTRSRRATRKNLSALLRRQRGPCALLLIAHGAYDDQHREGLVLLEGDDGSPDAVSGKVLRGLLTHAPGLRLVLLNLCLGAKAAPGEPFSGLAQGLIAGGVPAVVAMGWEVSDDAAAVFSPTCLSALCENRPLDEAVAAARLAMADRHQTRIEWASPVLFLHRECGHGWLFKVVEPQGGAGGPPADPLREANEVLERVNQAPHLDDIARAGPWLKQQRQWSQVLRFAAVGLDARPGDPLFERLAAEAAAELAIEPLARLCADLAGDAEGRPLLDGLQRLRGSWPEAVVEVAAGEVEEARELAEAYAEARQEEAAGHREEAARACWRLLRRRRGGYRDARRRLAALLDERRPERICRRGEEALDQEKWERAQSCFERLLRLQPGHRQAKVGCFYAAGRLAEEAADWTAALEAYDALLALEPACRDTVERRDRARLEAVREVLPWAGRLAAAGLIADPRAAATGMDPYAALAPADVHPGSPAADVREASFALMERGALTPEAREAWDRLRALPGRLLADAFLYRLRDPEEYRRRLAELEPGTEDEMLAALGKALPGDSPLFLLLAGRRRQAVAAWEERARQALTGNEPAVAETAHALALASLFEPPEEGSPEVAAAAWERAFAGWTLTLADDGYWESWRRQRQEAYGQVVTVGDLARLRSEVVQALLDRVAETSVAAAGDEAGPAGPALAFEVELEAARVLKEVGGLPLASGGRIGCGPLYLRRFGLGGELGRRVAALEAEAGGWEREELLSTLDAALGTGEAAYGGEQLTPEVLARLRCAFSELGRALLLLDRHQYPEAVAALPPLHRRKLAELPADCAAAPAAAVDLAEHCRDCPECRQVADRNPAYLCLPHRSVRLLQDSVELAARAYLGLAQGALGAGDAEAAFGGWRRAVEVSANAGTQVRTKRAVVRVVLGRVEALARERGRRRGERLTGAIALVEEARRLVGGAGEGQLEARLAKLLSARGVWHGYGCAEYQNPDYERAAADLRGALRLTPDSLHARDNLCRALIFHAANLQEEGVSPRALRLFAEAIAVLHEGLERTAGHRQLVEVLHRGLDELEELILFALSPEQLARRIERLGGAAPAGGDGAAAAASPPASGDDELGELMALIGVVRQGTADGRLRASLLAAVNALAAAREGQGV